MGKKSLFSFALLLLTGSNSVAQDTSTGRPDISSSSTIEVRTVPPGEVEQLQKDDAYWYANMPPEPKKPVADEAPKGKSLFRQEWFKNLLWLFILFSFIAIVIWYLAASNLNLFRKNSRSILPAEEDDTIHDDIFSIAYEKEINRAVAEKNYRLATRLWYLFTLKELADKKLIDYRSERTNSDYIFQLSGSKYHRHFFRLTRHFEYSWYGQFALSASVYQQMENDFTHFKNELAK